MKSNFYLQHPLMAMHDPQMKALLTKEGMKGIGAYWIIMEKLALLPEPCAPLEYMKPFCKSLKISFAYIKKIILDYQLFTFNEEDYFMPIELNSPQKKENKTAVSAKKSAKSERKMNGSTPLSAKNQPKSANNENQNSLNNSCLPYNTVTYNNIYIKTSSSSERKKETDDDDFFFEVLNSGRCAPLPVATSSPPARQPNHALKRPKARRSPPPTTALTAPNHAAGDSSAPWSGEVSAVVRDGKLRHWEPPIDTG